MKAPEGPPNERSGPAPEPGRSHASRHPFLHLLAGLHLFALFLRVGVRPRWRPVADLVLRLRLRRVISRTESRARIVSGAGHAFSTDLGVRMPDSLPIDDAVRPTSPAVVNTLVENHRRFLAFVERRVGSRELAEDILQEAFVRGLARTGQLRDDESAIAWFYRTLRNAMTDHWRRRGAEQRALDAVTRLASDDVEPAVDAELMDTVCCCASSLLDTLKPEYADALRQVDLGGASVKAWAEQAGITANNASVRLFRAREALRRQVERSCGTCATHGCVDCTCGEPKRA